MRPGADGSKGGENNQIRWFVMMNIICLWWPTGAVRKLG